MYTDIMAESGQESEQSPVRPLMVDRQFLGRSFGAFDLRDLTQNPVQEGEVNEVYFQTASGNIYSIGTPGKDSQPGSEDSGFALIDMLGNSDPNKPINPVKLSKTDVALGKLALEKSFHYGRSGVTTPIVNIVGIDSTKVFSEEELLKKSGGSYDDMRKRFWKTVNKGRTVTPRK